jgi:hypothetical protein
MADYRAKRFGAALSNFDFLAARGNLEAGLWAARSARAWRGCRGALGRYDRLAANAHGTPVGFDAVFEGAVCRKALGSVHDARSRFLSLLSVPSHASKARGELSSLNENKSASGRERSSGSFGPSTATP